MRCLTVLVLALLFPVCAAGKFEQDSQSRPEPRDEKESRKDTKGLLAIIGHPRWTRRLQRRFAVAHKGIRKPGRRRDASSLVSFPTFLGGKLQRSEQSDESGVIYCQPGPPRRRARLHSKA